MTKKIKTLFKCSRCKKIKKHRGHGMCCPCLRRTKRETKPSYYLGTCYSEISRRVKTKTIQRTRYYGLPKCTKEEFMNKFINDEQFLKLYKGWQDCNFKRGSAPSIDRIDNNKGYLIDNIEFIQNDKNGPKDSGIKLKLFKNGKFVDNFDSLHAVGRFTNNSVTTVFCWLHKNYKSKNGYTVEMINGN